MDFQSSYTGHQSSIVHKHFSRSKFTTTAETNLYINLSVCRCDKFSWSYWGLQKSSSDTVFRLNAAGVCLEQKGVSCTLTAQPIVLCLIGNCDCGWFDESRVQLVAVIYSFCEKLTRIDPSSSSFSWINRHTIKSEWMYAHLPPSTKPSEAGEGSCSGHVNGWEWFFAQYEGTIIDKNVLTCVKRKDMWLTVVLDVPRLYAKFE